MNPIAPPIAINTRNQALDITLDTLLSFFGIGVLGVSL